jgi:hypothetical protein
MQWETDVAALKVPHAVHSMIEKIHLMYELAACARGGIVTRGFVGELFSNEDRIPRYQRNQPLKHASIASLDQKYFIVVAIKQKRCVTQHILPKAQALLLQPLLHLELPNINSDQ